MPDQPTLFAAPGNSAFKATFSPCGRMRFTLHHRWAPGPTWTWVMLNPSVAGSGQERDNLDPTLRRCMGFSRAGGAGAMTIVNLWPWVGQDPADLWAAMDAGEPVDGGRLGLAAIEAAATGAGMVVCGWGSFSKARGRHLPAARARARLVLDTIENTGMTPHALSVTTAGNPGHPLYLPAALAPRPLNDLLLGLLTPADR
jgi:hypothetical protein